MSCTRWTAMIDAAVDTPLDADTQQRLDAHLASCTSCRAWADDLDALRVATRALPASIEPPRDLWPTIEHRLSTPGVAPVPTVAPWRNGVLVAVAAALIAALATWTWMRQDLATAPTSPAASPEVQLASYEAAAAGPAIASTREAALALRLAVEDQWSSLSPATRTVLETNLTVIDQAIAEIETALASEPGDRGLQTLLLANYRQQITLLERLAELTRT